MQTKVDATYNGGSTKGCKHGTRLATRRQYLWQRHSPSVRRRFELEWEVAISIVRAALKAGYLVTVDNGEDATEHLKHITDVMDVMFETDEDTLLFGKPGTGALGWAKLIWGNSGYDALSDYSTNMEYLMAGASKIFDDYTS